jgi:hypothetical protein
MAASYAPRKCGPGDGFGTPKVIFYVHLFRAKTKLWLSQFPPLCKQL